MLRELSGREWCEWQAFNQLEPLGEKRADWRSAQVVAALYNIFTRKKGDPVNPISNFLLTFKSAAPKRTQTNAEKRRNLELWAMAIAGAPGPGKRRRATPST